MQSKLPQEHGRVQFQVDRIAFFSDAIIAIAITLLVLEIKIPALGQNTSWRDIKPLYIKQLLYPLLSLFFSFLIIGRLWMRHHELFEHIHNYNHKLIRYNLFFLFSVVLLPVSTMFMMNDDNPKEISVTVFVLNLATCQLLFTILLNVILQKKNHFYNEAALPIIKKQRRDSLEFFGILMIVTVVVFFKKPSWVPFLFLPYFFYRLGRRRKEVMHLRKINKEDV